MDHSFVSLARISDCFNVICAPQLSWLGTPQLFISPSVENSWIRKQAFGKVTFERFLKPLF